MFSYKLCQNIQNQLLQVVDSYIFVLFRFGLVSQRMPSTRVTGRIVSSGIPRFVHFAACVQQCVHNLCICYILTFLSYLIYKFLCSYCIA